MRGSDAEGGSREHGRRLAASRPWSVRARLCAVFAVVLVGVLVTVLLTPHAKDSVQTVIRESTNMRRPMALAFKGSKWSKRRWLNGVQTSLSDCHAELESGEVQLTDAAVEAGAERIRKDSEFGQLLYCVAKLPFVRTFFDVFCGSGDGSSHLIAQGLAMTSTVSARKTLLSLEVVGERFDEAAINLEPFKDECNIKLFNEIALTSMDPPDGSMVRLCMEHTVDAMLLDGDGGDTPGRIEMAREEWRVTKSMCRPAFLAINRAASLPVHREVVEELKDSADWVQLREGKGDILPPSDDAADDPRPLGTRQQWYLFANTRQMRLLED